MQHLRGAWTSSSQHPYGTMLWAAACIGFFGFLCTGGFTVPCIEGYNPGVDHNLANLALDSHSEPSMVLIMFCGIRTEAYRFREIVRTESDRQTQTKYNTYAHFPQSKMAD